MAKILSNTTNLVAKFSIILGILFLATFLYSNIASAAPADPENLIADMGDNERTLMNAPDTDWSKHAYLDMGFSTRGDATPRTWYNAQGGTFTSPDPWEAILPWFQIWPVEGNSGESRVKVSNIQVQMLIGGTWQTLDYPTEQWGQVDQWDLIGGKGGVDQREEGDGAYSYLIDNSGPVHGGLGKVALSELGVDPASIEGVAISAVAEIVEGNGEILFEIGGDYYPNVDVQVEDYVLQWGPAIGGSKFSLIEGTRCIYMTTIDPPGQGDGSVYADAGGKVALTHDELRANPPEDLCDGATGSATTDDRPKLDFTSTGVAGTEAVLEWEGTNVDTCTASGGTASWNGEVGTEGTQTITDLTKSTSFTLTCEGEDGLKVRKSLRLSSDGNLVEQDEGDGEIIEDEEESERHFDNSEDGDGRGDSPSEESSSASDSDSSSDSQSSGREAVLRVLNLLVEKLLQLLDLYQRLLGL